MQATLAAQQRPAQVRFRAVLAQRGSTGLAGDAPPAYRYVREDDMIASDDTDDATTDLLDDAGRLVTEDHRQRPAPRAVDHRQIGVAQSCGDDPHAELAGTRAAERQDRKSTRLNSSH